MMVAIAIVLYGLLLAGLGGLLWYESGRVSAAQRYVITCTALRLAGMTTALALVAVTLLVIAAPS
jgi:hypothetical protein